MSRKERESYLTCCHCVKPLSENQIVKDAYKQNTAMSWAVGQLEVLAQIIDGRNTMHTGDLDWLSGEIRKIYKSLPYLKY